MFGKSKIILDPLFYKRILTDCLSTSAAAPDDIQRQARTKTDGGCDV